MTLSRTPHPFTPFSCIQYIAPVAPVFYPVSTKTVVTFCQILSGKIKGRQKQWRQIIMLLPVISSWCRCLQYFYYMCVMCDVAGCLVIIMLPDLWCHLTFHLRLPVRQLKSEVWGMYLVWQSEVIRGNSYIIVASPDTTHQYLLADDLQTQWKNAVRATDLSINIAQTQP